MLYLQGSGAHNDSFLSNAFKRCFRLSGLLLKLCRLILGCAKIIYLFGYSRGAWVFLNLLGLFSPFSENLRSNRLSENDSWPFLSTQNDIFINPKTTDIKFLMSRQFQVTILLKKSRERDWRPSEQIIYRNDWVPLKVYIWTALQSLPCIYLI